MKIIFIISSSLLLLTLGFQRIDLELLKKDPIMIEYKKAMKNIRSGIVEKRYQLPSNALELQKEFTKNPTKENMKTLYLNAGMKNANEYVDQIFLQTTLMIDFLKKYPEITRLEQQAKIDLLKKLLLD